VRFGFEGKRPFIHTSRRKAVEKGDRKMKDAATKVCGRLAGSQRAISPDGFFHSTSASGRWVVSYWVKHSLNGIGLQKTA
jgi:hypothetical protein